MQLVRAAAWTVFLHFKPTRIIPAVLDGGVITFFTLNASQMDHWSDVFFLRCHNFSTWLPGEGQP